jgi:uncharacterized protein (DUF58 family)
MIKTDINNFEAESFIDEDFLRKIAKLRILSQKKVYGMSKGEHKSRKSGTSIEFLDYRKYHIGDDLRYVDWNVYGRLDKLFIKIFSAEEDQNIHLILDMSNSMSFGSPGKSIMAKKIAAALMYIGLSNQDRVSLTSFSTELDEFKPPAKGKKLYVPLLNYLLKMKPEGETGFNTSLNQFTNTCKTPGLAIIISDLLDPAGITEGLTTLKYGRFDVHIIHILDNSEIVPTKKGYFVLQDIETMENKPMTINQNLLDNYQKNIQHLIRETKLFCRKNKISYNLYDTSTPFEDFLLSYLTQGALKLDI